jgi:hypothetical protein
MNITTTQVAATPLGEVGPLKSSTNATARAVPDQMRNGRRRPPGCVDRSLIRPAIGLRTTSQALGRKTMSPARPAAIPSRSVR